MNLTTILRTAKAALTSSSISNLATATSSSRKPRFFTSALLVLSFVFSLLRVESGWGQNVTVSFGTSTGLTSSYSSLAAAVTALNSATINSPVTLTLASGYTETAPAGGFSITKSGTATNTITIQGFSNASRNVITAPTQTSGGLVDAIFKLVGADYITIQYFDMRELSTNTTTSASTNNMTEFGVALFYNTSTDGSQNITIKNNTITLNRTYQNTFGIYSNSTHSNTSPATSASATGASGGNDGLTILGNIISNVNQGICVVGPTAAADAMTGINIGGSSLSNGNTISNYGTTGTFSSYANVSGTVNGILIRNAIGFNVSYNSITSSDGGVTAGTLNGIQIPASSNAPTTTFTNTISNNTISLQTGFTTGSINGINYPAGSASATSVVNISNNTFTRMNSSVVTSGAFDGILCQSTNLTTTISNNQFSNLVVNTTGNFRFIVHSFSIPVNGSVTISNNSIVTAFNKNQVGGTVTLTTTSASSPNSASLIQTNNDFSNITVTGATALTGFNNTDGSSSSSNKTISGNVFNNWSGGTSAILVMNYNYWGLGATNELTNNTITNINGSGGITAISIGSIISGNNPLNFSGNTIAFLTATGSSSVVLGINCLNASTSINISGNSIYSLTGAASSIIAISLSTSTTNVTVSRNKIYSLTSTIATASITGIYSASTGVIDVYNNIVSDLTIPTSTNNHSIKGFVFDNASGTINATYNTIYLAGLTSSQSPFGATGIYYSNGATLNLRNNIIYLSGTANGTGNLVCLRRWSGSTGVAPSTYSTSSNNNLFYSGTPSTSNLIYAEGTTTSFSNPMQTLSAYKAFMSTRDQSSFTENPTFQSTSGSNANYMKYSTTVATQLEGGGVPVSGVTTDISGALRSATNPDVGAWELAGITSDLTSPNIAYTPLSNACAATFTLTATITDASGVPTSGTGLPRLYVKINSGSYSAITGTSIGSNQFTFSFGSSAVAGDVISYYIIAQDNASTPNVGAFPSAGASGFTASPPAVSTAPTTPSSFTVISPSSLGITATATASPAAICTGANSNLNVSFLKSTSTTLGNGGTTGSSYDAIFYHLYGGCKSQFLVKASELSALGLTAGNITSFGINMTAVTSATYAGFAISMASTSNSDMSTGINSVASFNSVYSNSTFSPVTGTNTFNISSSPFYWDGTSNIIIQFCWSNSNTGGTSNYAKIDALGFVSCAYYRADSSTPSIICGGTSASGTSSNRPQFYFTGNSAPFPSVYSWSPSTALTSTTISNPVANPTSTTAYTCTATVNGCPIVSNAVTITVNPLPTTPTNTTTANQCGTSATFSISTTVTSPVYKWYTASSGGSAIAGATSASYTVSGLSPGNYTYYASITNTNGCESQRVACQVTLSGADPLIATAANISCLGNTTTLTVQKTSSNFGNNYSYTWSLGTYTGSGLSGPTNGNLNTPLTITPTLASTYIYTVTGSESSTGCTALATVTVVVSNPNAGITATASASAPAICLGQQSSVLNYSLGTISNSSSYCIPTSATSSSSYFDMFSTTGGISNINNAASGFSVNGFGVFTSQIVQANLNQTINFNTTIVGTTVGVAIWVDWNQNGTFETSERVYVTSGYVSTASGSFVVPNTALIGTTRMRILMDYNTSVPANPCGPFASGRGEIEDYSFKVGPSPSAFSWSPSTALTSTTISNPVANPTSTTAYTCIATVNGCPITSNAVTVSVNPLPTIVANAASSTICLGTNTGLTATGGSTYSWSPSTNLSSSTSATPTFTPSASGNSQSYTVTGTDANGCTNTAQVSVNVLGLPSSVTVMGTSPNCDNTTLNASGGSGGSIYYQGTSSNGTSTATLSSTQTVNASGTYYFRSYNGTCFGPQGSLSVVINTQPVITVQPSTVSEAKCNLSQTFSPLSITATGTNLTYQWYSNTTSSTSGGTSITGATSATYTPSNATVGTTYYYCVVSSASCPSTTSAVSGARIVITSPVAPVVLPLTQTVNVGASATFTSTRSTASNTLTWWTAASGGTEIDPDGPTLSVDSVFNSYDAVILPTTSIDFCTPNLTNSSSTIYKYYVQQYDGTCPSPRTEVMVFTNPLVTSSSSNNLICQSNATVTLTANVTQETGSVIQWLSNTNSTGSFTNVSNSNPVTVQPAISTMYQLNTASLMPFGCTGSFNSTLVSLASTQQSVLVYPSLDFTPASNPSSVCIGGTSTLTPNTPTGNFTASCITPVSSLSTPPSGVTVNTLVTNGAIQTLPSGVTVYSSSLDDNYWGNVPIGFTYNFFGQNANTVYIGSNGTIVVGISGAVGSTQYNFTGGFPNSANPANTVAVSARDLHMAHGTVRYWTEGFAPTRRFIVQYDSLRTYTNSCDVSPYSNYGYGYQKAEAVFYETSGIIDIRVIKATNGTSWSSLCSTGASNSVKKYIGLQDPSKSIGATAPNCSSPYQANYWNGITNEITSPLAWRFAPPANYNIKWFLGTGNSASLVANLPYVSGAASSTYNYSTLSSQSQNPGQVSYTVSATNTNTNCPSSQTLAITVNALPVAPNSGGNVTACSNATTTTLSAIAPSGCTIDWYSNINGTGTPLASGTSNYSFAPSSVAGVYTYYAFSKNTSTGCMSANGTAILLTVYQAPAPPVSATTAFTYCEGANATQLTATPLSGNTLNWYSGTLSSTPSSTAPTPSTATNSGSPFTFYATQVSGTNGCQSNATTFTVTVNNTPAAPVLAATSATSGFSINPQGTISYCQGATTYPLWATGLSSNLLNNPGSSQQYWYYTSPTGSGGQTSTSPIPSSATAGAMTYYVSRQNTTTLCEGARTPLIVVINPSLTPVVSISATSTSVCSGGAITFTATPTNGGPTPTYQWYLNGSVVSGQTTPTYTLANPNVGDAIYVTMVSNEPSCLFTPNATSATVTLSNGAASPSVSIIQSTGSTICAGTAVTFSVLSSANMGGIPTYSWKVNGVNVGLGSSYTTTSLVNSDLVTLNMTSSLSSSCINGNATAISNGISMTVTPATAISAQPVNAAVCLGGAQSLSVTAVGTGTITYQWKSAATSAGPFTNIPFASNSSSQSSTLSIPSVSGQLSYQLVASSSCGTATSSIATISINQATAITAQPQAIVACQGTSATFSVTAIGTGVVSYQWRYNGVPISGATSSTYTIPSLSLSSPGQYSVVVSASCGSVTSSNAQLSVNPLTTISNQPTGVSICDSNAFSLSVTASGTAPITYQWYRGATAISGATSALYSDLNGVVSESGNYTVVVTGGCSNVTSSVATVLINPNTWITAQPQTYAGCALNPTSLSVTGLGANLQYQWNLGSNPSNPITGATNSTLSFSNPQTSNSGSYSVTLTGVCGTQTSNIALVTINPVPSAGTIIGGNSGVCVGSSINLTNLASGGVWSTSNSALANISSTGVLTGVSAGSITVTYTVTNSFGCVSVATKIIQVKGLPSAVIQTPLATSICQGESMNLLASAAVSYMWSNGATTQSTSVNSSATGTSNYSVSVTGTNGCTASSAPLAITVIPVPTIASISGSGNFPNLCLGNATNLSNATPNGLWSSNNTTVMTVNPNTGSANALAIGTATISYHVANIPGCLNPNPGTATVSITVSTPPSAYITPSGSTTFCSGGSVILSAPIGAGYNYLWSNGSTSQSITVSTSGTLTVTVTAAGGCSVTSLPTTVNVLPIPTATIYPTGAINICSGTNVTLSTGSAVSYLWSNGVNTPTISVNTAGTYSVTLTGTNGCTATSAVSTVTVTPVPSAVITANGPTNICDGGSVGLSVPTAQSYLWSNGATTQAITATSTGNYSVTATNGICSATSTPTFVNFNPVPSSVITASGPTTFCQGGNVSLSAPNGNSYTYLWTNGATSQSITVSNTGVYGVTVSNSFGCSSTSIPVSVIVNSLPVASITAAGSTTICSGSFVNLSAPAGGTYLWSNGATTQFINAASAGNYTVTVSTLAGCSATSTPTTISVNALPSAAISSNGSTTFCQGGNVGLTANNGMSAYLWSNGNTGQSISATSSGSYSVQVTDANGCSANSNVISVVVNQAPIATIYPGTNVTICSGSSVTLSTNSASSYTWSNGSHSPTVQVNTSGLYSVTLTGSNGCSATSSVTTVAVTTTPTAAITASGPTTICQGSNVNLSAPAAANTYLWNTGATTQSINVSLVGSYYVTVGSNGCSATSPSTFVSYNPVPSAAVTASGPTTFCQGNSVTFSAPAGNGNTYVWNTGATTQSVSTSTAGNFSVTVTNGYGCSATSTTSSVLINPLPVVTPITGSSSICAGTQGQVSNVMTGGVYASSNLGVASIGQLSGQITGLTAGTTTISYVYTNANGCSNTVTYPVNIIAAPVATITAGGPTTFCQGGSVLLTASSGTSYVWNTGETTATITATTAGNYSVTVTGANGCSATSLATTVNILTPSPVSAINGASAVCVNSATALTNASSGGVWTSSTPAVATISAAGIVTGVSAGTTTISYTINSTNGCQNTTTKVVTVNAVPSTALTASGATTFCQGGNVQLTASAGATYAWNNGATTSSITATTAGTYNVTVTNANGCSSVSTNQTITVNALPIAQISTNGSTNLCTGGSITLMATPSASYLWSTGATTSSITTSTAGTYTVAVTNANGCSATSTATNVAVNASPSATVTASGPTTICSGNNVVLTATSVVGNTYQWMKNGVLIPGATLNVYTATTSGSYSLLVTNASGCSSTSAGTAITVNDAPVANITAGGATNFCSGGSVTLTASAGTSYLWSTGATTASIIATTAGSRTVTVTNAAGCSTTSAPINIVVNTMPTATITAGGPTSICSGSNVTLTASGGSTYVWNNGATTASIVANTSGNYSVTVYNANGCSAISTPTTVTVNNPSVANVSTSGPTTFCQGGSVNLTATTAASYAWSNGATTQSISVNTSGNYSVVLTNASGCTSTSPVIAVTANALPTATITAGGSTTFCQGGSVTLTASPATSYLWSNGATGSSINVTTAGNYTVQIANNSGCTANSAATTVTVNALPVATITAGGSLSICAGSSVNLTASTGTAYLWSNGATTATIAASNAGNYTVQVSNAAGCTSTSSVSSVIVNALPTPSITSVGSTTICQGASVTLTTANGSGLTYQWKNNGTNISGATAASYVASTAGNYTVQMTNAAGCSGTSTATTVTVNALPVASISNSGSNTICSGSSVNLTASTGTTYAWSNGATTATIAVNATGNYSVIVTNAAGCTNSAATTITVVTPTVASISANGPTYFCTGQNVVLTANTGASYLWSTGATTASITVAATSNISVQVTYASGCVSTSPITAVNVNALPVASITASGATSFCPGSSVTLTASNGSSYVWTNGATTNSIVVSSAGSYGVTVANAAGCSSVAAPTSIVVFAAPTATITPSAATTFCQGASINLTANAAAGYAWSNGASTSSISVNNSGNFTVTVTDANGCSAISSVVPVTVNAVPVASIQANGPTTVCQGTSVVLTANGGTGFAWSNSETTASITVNATGSYGVTVTNAAGCSSVVTPVSITVNPVQILSPIVGATNVCVGSSTTYTNSTSGGTWSSDNTAVAAVNATNGIVSGISTGSATIKYQFVNASGCTSEVTKVVTVNGIQPVSIAASGSTTFCQGGTVTLTAPAGLNYNWTNGATTQSITVNASGIYGITASNVAGCSTTSSTVAVTVNPAPVASISSTSTALCQGSNLVLNAPANAATYAWSNGATTQNVLITAPGVYSLTLTDANGCSASASTTIVNGINPVATIAAGGATTFCSGGSVVLNAAGGTSFLWNNGATTQNITVNTPGNYSVMVTNAAGCSAMSNATMVNVLQSPNAVATAYGPTTFCQGGSVTIATSGGATYAWSNGSTAQSILPTTSGTYSVVVTAVNGCTATSNPINVTVNPTPTAVITPSGTTTFCEGSSVNLVASGGSNYAWSNGPNTSSITITTGGTYTVTVTNAGGCTDTETISVTVNEVPSAFIVTSGATTFCQGGQVNLTAQAGNSYLWSNNATTQSISVASAGTYSVTIQSPNGCSVSSNAISVTVNQPSASSLNATAFDSYTLNGILYTQSGTYTQNLTNAAGCDSTITLNLTLTVGIEEGTLTDVNVYPNPTSESFTIKTTVPVYGVYSVVDAQGKLIFEGELTGTETQINISSVARGIYYLRIPELSEPLRVVKN